MNHEHIQNKISCYRCRTRTTFPGEILCLTCKEDEKVAKFLAPFPPEGQKLDEHLFPIQSTQNVLALTH